MFTKSIRWRLQLWLAFLLVCLMGGFGVTAYQLHRTNQLHQIDQELQRRITALNTALRVPPPFGVLPGRPPTGDRHDLPPFDDGPDHPRLWRSPPDLGMPRGGFEMRPGRPEVRLAPQVLQLFDETETNGFYFAVWSRDNNVLRRSTNVPMAVPVPKPHEAVTAANTRMRGVFREAFHFTALGDCILVGRCITSDLRALRRFAWWLAVVGGGVLLLGLGGGWRLASHTIRPIEDISATARRISAGNLAERISIADPANEMGRLAEVLNSTFARLEAAFAQQKQFTADASHELRTPIAVLISEAQTVLARPRSTQEYRETVEACLETAQQMRRLTDSLLELARFDAGQESLRRRPFDLAETTRACLERVRPLALEHGVQIQTALEPAPAFGDADRVEQVVTNLLSNAVYYNRKQGEIRVHTSVTDGAAVLTVADTGIGIAPEHLPHLFDRFYRVDPSRSKASGRNGLGLAISKAIVDAHRGTIEVSSQPDAGTTFTVQLPGSSPAPRPD